jgi:hypothetical protein
MDAWVEVCYNEHRLGEVQRKRRKFVELDRKSHPSQKTRRMRHPKVQMLGCVREDSVKPPLRFEAAGTKPGAYI